MLQKLLMWAEEVEGPSEEEARGRERRTEGRQDFTCADLAIRNRRSQSLFHLKDMSCRGASGISDMPLAVGAIIFLQLRKGRYHAAEVRWVRNALIGLRFFRPLESSMLLRLKRSRNRSGPPARRRRRA